MSRNVIGIDLGTLNSCVAAVREGRAEVLRGDNRGIVPSCVGFKDGKVLVGAPAKRHAVSDPQSTLIAIKRLIGHAFDSREVREAAEQLPYKIKKSRLGSVVLQIGDEELSPVQVSTLILAKVKEIAETALGSPVGEAVISVPAHFNDVQRKATMLAAEDAGLKVLRLVNEPTAAAFAYGYKKAKDFTLAVYDLGGGTFDVTVLRARGNTFSVVATDGDSYLGGEDFDLKIAEWLEAEFTSEFGQGFGEDRAARQRVREAAEKAKVELTEVETSQIELPFLTKLDDGTRPGFSRTITRAKVAELVSPLIARTRELCERCLQTASISVNEISEVLLVGGQSRMPAVREVVRDLFAKEPRRDINPDEVVAMGAALYAYSLVSDDLAQEAEDEAKESFAVAVKETSVARKLVNEIADLGTAEIDNKALADRLEALLAAAEAGGAAKVSEPQVDDDPTQPSMYTLDPHSLPPVASDPPPQPKNGSTSQPIGRVHTQRRIAAPEPPAPKFDEPVDQVEPSIAEHDPLDDSLSAAQTDTASADEPALPELDESPALELDEPVDDFPAPKFDEPVDDFPVPKFDEPVDDFPVPKFDEPVDQVEPPIAEHDPLDDFLNAAQTDTASADEPALPELDEPVDDFPVPKFDEPVDQVEPPIAEHDPLDDFLNAAQ
ncbi:MAG: Hsp70 family protein, partial [bacterium]|nr:Hsp70 family protein [bacterium]